MADSALEQALRQLTREAPTQEEFAILFKDIEKQDDRAFALIAASALEASLAAVIETKFIMLTPPQYFDLYSRGGPLSDLYGKILIGHALGIFGDTILGDLQLIRSIRNTFAHAMRPITFATPAISSACSKFSSISTHRSKIGLVLFSNNSSDPKNNYLNTINFIRTIIFQHCIEPPRVAKPEL